MLAENLDMSVHINQNHPDDPMLDMHVSEEKLKAMQAKAEMAKKKKKTETSFCETSGDQAMKSVEYEILEGVTNPHQRAWKGGVRLTFIAGGTGSKSAYWKFKDAVGGTGYLKPAQVEEVKDDVDPPAATSDDESEPPEVSSPGSPINLSSGKNSPGSYDGNAAGVEEAEEAPATIASE
ncbi:hypothetical protein CYMTET_56141, partial [Cymbomonas tetramitiformis]